MQSVLKRRLICDLNVFIHTTAFVIRRQVDLISRNRELCGTYIVSSWLWSSERAYVVSLAKSVDRSAQVCRSSRQPSRAMSRGPKTQSMRW